MTDVFICYSREDRDRVRPIAEGLQAEGWDVWWDPSVPLRGENDNIDQKLGSAGAVLVVWSAASRGSEYVRSEAATGLYKNKLIQTRIDSAAPPRPFDQVEVTDLGVWSGDRDDPNWRKVVGAARLFAGPPGSGVSAARPQVMKRAAAPVFDSIPEDAPYLEERRTMAPGPILFGAALVILAGVAWLADPFGWRATHPARPAIAAAAPTPLPAAAKTPEPAAGLAPPPVDTPASEAAWGKIDRTNPAQLRAFLGAYPGTVGAESARSMLRVLDAQAWADAVIADNEKAYTTYLVTFPADPVAPGAMVAAARDRLASLAVERAQAIADMQTGLIALKLYSGKIDGQPGDGTARAVKAFAQAHKRTMPDLKSAAPRTLRAFGDLIVAESSKVSPNATAVSAAVPAPAPAAPAAPGAATPAASSAAAPTSTAAAAAADRQRLAAAEDAKRAAEAAQRDAAVQASAETAARAKDQSDFDQAKGANSASAYQTYLRDHPAGIGVAEARSALARLTRPASFSVNQLSPQVRSVVEVARQAQSSAQSRAAAARGTASRADEVAAAARTGAVGTQILSASDGARYETQVSGGAPNGLGVKVTAQAAAKGDRYRGEMRNGLDSGLGVYEFSDNPNNAQAGALRYEGEHAGDRSSGLGVTYWKNGDVFAGQLTGASSRGVLNFSDGSRYEGEMSNGARNGLGVVWSADGQVLMAGRWTNGVLAEPMAQEQTSAPAAAPGQP